MDDARAEAAVGSKAIEKMRGVLRRRPDLEQPLRNGDLSLNAAMAEAGFHQKQSDLALGQAFGKGDRWREASEPLVRYLNGWALRGMEFRHLNPQQARKRIERIEILEGLLAEMKNDLTTRGVRASLSAPRATRERHDA
ncbi:MAG TPA: hypothetical protein VGF24_37175 [Vicinamibacterales bacterium]